MARKTFINHRNDNFRNSQLYREDTEDRLRPIILTDTEGWPLTAPALPITKVYPLGGMPLVNSSDSEDMTVDGSVTPVEYALSPADGEVYCITSLHIIVIDTGMSFDEFGGTGSALTNGLSLVVKRGGVQVFDLTAGRPIVANWQLFSRNAGTVASIKSLGGEDMIESLFATGQNIGRPVYLDGSLGDQLSLTIRDNLSAISHFTITVAGWREPSV